MTGSEMIERINRGEHVVTYEMVHVRPDRAPVSGEIRYIVPLVPARWEPLASMMPLDPVRIIWDGAKWIPT